VNEVKRKALLELQKAMAESEAKASHLLAAERAKMELAVAEARKQAMEEMVLNFNSQQESTEVIIVIWKSLIASSLSQLGMLNPVVCVANQISFVENLFETSFWFYWPSYKFKFHTQLNLVLFIYLFSHLLNAAYKLTSSPLHA